MKATSIALCRVSTVKQSIEGSSLEAQEKRVKEASEIVDAPIEKFWNLSISSRKGKNFKRRDLHEMLAYCKLHKRVRYVIVDEVDRFMRSIDEFYYWKVRFREEANSVQLVYAAKPQLVSRKDLYADFEEMIDVFKAQASNQERITKTTEKMQARIMAGYYPGVPKQGYKRTMTPGLHERREPQWGLLRTAFHEVLSRQYTIHEVLARLHAKGYKTTYGKDLDMERFKTILLDPYYAGIVQMSNWPTNPKGLHEAMITPDDHEIVKDIVSGKKKISHKQFNPKYPLSKIMGCMECELDKEARYPRITGYDHNNGKKGNSRKVYEKYRCRSCKKEHGRQEVHNGLSRILESIQLHPERRDEFIAALRQVWEKEHSDNARYAQSLESRLNELTGTKNSLVLSMVEHRIDEEDGKAALESLKKDIKAVTEELSSSREIEKDFVEFVDFTMGFIDRMQQDWWSLDQKHLDWCKQLLFPEGFSVSRSGKVHTPKISEFYRLATIEKGPEEPSISNMVTPAGFEPAIFWMRTKYPGPLDDGADLKDRIILPYLLISVQRGYRKAKSKPLGDCAQP